VIVAQKVQKAMERQNPQLCGQIVPFSPCLPGRDAKGDGKIA
jgi:hypothetical protein